MPESPGRVSTVRHWKQRFRKTGPFRWRRPTIFGGVKFAAGEVLPDGLLSFTKARRLWRSHRIEMADFQAPPDVTTGARPALVEPQQPQAPAAAPRRTRRRAPDQPTAV